jgi:hypothetical protein
VVLDDPLKRFKGSLLVVVDVVVKLSLLMTYWRDMLDADDDTSRFLNREMEEDRLTEPAFDLCVVLFIHEGICVKREDVFHD